MKKEIILLTDDRPDSLQAFGTVLKNAGYRIAMAGGGEECLKVAGKIKPALILLDIVMPGMDGFETCIRLKADSRLREIPHRRLPTKSGTKK